MSMSWEEFEHMNGENNFNSNNVDKSDALDFGMTINSEDDAWEYWTTFHGMPEQCGFNQMTIVENIINSMEDKYIEFRKDVNNAREGFANIFKVNKLIELHFLLKVGKEFLDECIDYSAMEDVRDFEYERDFSNEFPNEFYRGDY